MDVCCDIKTIGACQGAGFGQAGFRERRPEPGQFCIQGGASGGVGGREGSGVGRGRFGLVAALGSAEVAGRPPAVAGAVAGPGPVAGGGRASSRGSGAAVPVRRGRLRSAPASPAVRAGSRRRREPRWRASVPSSAPGSAAAAGRMSVPACRAVAQVGPWARPRARGLPAPTRRAPCRPARKHLPEISGHSTGSARLPNSASQITPGNRISAHIRNTDVRGDTSCIPDRDRQARAGSPTDARADGRARWRGPADDA